MQCHQDSKSERLTLNNMWLNPLILRKCVAYYHNLFTARNTVNSFLHMGQGFPHQLPELENVILHPHVRRVACDDVTIPCALLLYKIAFILLGSSRKQ